MLADSFLEKFCSFLRLFPEFEEIVDDSAQMNRYVDVYWGWEFHILIAQLFYAALVYNYREMLDCRLPISFLLIEIIE